MVPSLGLYNPKNPHWGLLLARRQKTRMGLRVFIVDVVKVNYLLSPGGRVRMPAPGLPASPVTGMLAWDSSLGYLLCVFFVMFFMTCLLLVCLCALFYQLLFLGF